MERSLVLRRCLYGNDSDEAIKACKLVVDTCNGLATAYLTQGLFVCLLAGCPRNMSD